MQENREEEQRLRKKKENKERYGRHVQGKGEQQWQFGRRRCRVKEYCKYMPKKEYIYIYIYNVLNNKYGERNKATIN